MTLHAHAWTHGVAPDYSCACGDRAWRDPRTGRLRIVDAEVAERGDSYREYMAEGDLARREHRVERPEPDRTLAVDEQFRREERSMGSRSNGSRIRRHQWTEADEAALEQAVEVVAGPDEPAHQLAFWSAVAGRLLPGLVVSPSACRTRHTEIHARRLEAERLRALAHAQAEAEREARQEAADIEAYATPADGSPDAFEALAQRIATMEMEAADDLAAALTGLRVDVGELDLRVRAWDERLERIEAYVSALAAAWDVTP